MRAIGAWKDRHLTSLTQTFAGLLVENEPLLRSLEPLQIITPPLRRKAFATRGFNAISLLAKELKKSNPNIFYDENAISYRYQPRDQRSLGIGERKFNVQGAFSVNEISDLPILILDDVWTTGSTLRELVLAIAKPERVSTLLVLSTAYQVGTKDVWKSGSA